MSEPEKHIDNNQSFSSSAENDDLGEILQKLYEWGYECGSNQASDYAWELKLDPNEHISLDDATKAIEDFYRNKILQEKFQLKANIFTMFNVAMAKQDLSARPPEGARFRTPLEELSIILENQIPLDDITAQFNSRGDNNGL